MPLNNSEYNRLRFIIRESLLNEDNRREVIVNKLKLPESIAEWAYNISPKLSIWIANDFKDRFLEGQVPNELVKTNLIKQLEAGNESGGMKTLLDTGKRRLEGNYRHIADWTQGRTQGPARETDKINLRELTYEEAMRRSDAWHEELARHQPEEEMAIEDADGDVIKTYPDGYYWINLGKRYCEKEGRAMGHCGRGEGILYSLRKGGVPHVTADILENGAVRQLRGRANSKPKSEYHPYIKDLILSDIVDHFDYWDYRIRDNFELLDLGGEEEVKSIIKRKPSLLKNQGMLLNYLTHEDLVEMIRGGFSFGDEEKNEEAAYPKEEFQSLFDVNPSAFKSLYVHLKYGSSNHLSNLHEQFEEDGVRLEFSGWDDENLIDMFGHGYTDLAKEISSEDFNVEWDGYFLGESILDLELPKIDSLNLRTIIKFITEALGKDETKEALQFGDSGRIVLSKAQDKVIGTLYEMYTSNMSYDNLAGDIIMAIKRALAEANSVAVRDEYWKLFIEPLKEALGDYKWEGDKLIFKTPYKDYAFQVNASDEERSYAHDAKFYTVDDVINENFDIEGILSEGEEGLTIDTPYYGVEADTVNAGVFNERLMMELDDISIEDLNEVVSNEVENTGRGGIESQTKDDTMGYYHGESGPLHQGPQPAESEPHLFFGGGGREQAGEQSAAADESGAKEQVEDGME